MIVPFHSQSPGICDFIEKDQWDVPSPSQPQPSSLKTDSVDHIGLKKAAKSELLSLGQRIDKSID